MPVQRRPGRWRTIPRRNVSCASRRSGRCRAEPLPMPVVSNAKKPRQKSVREQARQVAWKRGETIAHYITGVLDRESMVEIGESLLSIFSHALAPRTGSVFVGAEARRLTY